MTSKTIWQELPKPFLVLAPMEDVTDTVFRRIVGECAPPDLYVTEFTSTDGLCSRGKDKVAHRLQYTEKERPLIAQIWGAKPENFYKAAQMIVEMGFDGIDINMGCPVKKITKGGGCSALIAFPSLAAEVIQATREGIEAAKGSLPVSVKTRIGTNKIMTEEWIGFLLEQHIDALTIHGRTVKEMSEVPAHWDEIGKAVTLRDQLSPNTILIGNGDVRDRADAKAKVREYGVDGVMIGRGIFQNLWAFADPGRMTEPTKEERLDLLLKHAKLFEDTWGRTKNFAILRRFFKCYAKDFDGAAELRAALMQTLCYDDVCQIIQANR